MLRHGTPVSVRTRNNYIYFRSAVMFGVCDICTHFVRKQTARYSQEEKKNRTLVSAARNGHDECLKKILTTGVNVNYQCKSGNTALWHAMHSRKEYCADVLIEAGADVNKTYAGGTLLAWSAGRGFHRNIAKLLKAGADVNAPDVNPPIIEAVQGGHEFCLKLLIDAGAAVNCTNKSFWRETAMMTAAEKGSTGCMRILKNAGADVSREDSTGKSALEFAVESGSLKSIELLINWGADVNHVDKYGDPALMKALTKDAYPDCVQLLIKHGVNVKSRDSSGKSALVYAAENSCEQSMRILIEEGADVNMAVNQGYEAGLTPLITSAEAGSINCVRMLLKAGAYVNKTLQNKGSNAIACHLSRSQRNEDLLKLLLVAGEATTDREIMKLVFHGPAEDMKDEGELHFEEEQDINLMYKCRDAIRGHIAATNPRVNMFTAVAQLGLPDLMCSYLLYNLTLTE